MRSRWCNGRLMAAVAIERHSVRIATSCGLTQGAHCDLTHNKFIAQLTQPALSGCLLGQTLDKHGPIKLTQVAWHAWWTIVDALMQHWQPRHITLEHITGYSISVDASCRRLQRQRGPCQPCMPASWKTACLQSQSSPWPH